MGILRTLIRSILLSAALILGGLLPACNTPRAGTPTPNGAATAANELATQNARFAAQLAETATALHLTVAALASLTPTPPSATLEASPTLTPLPATPVPTSPTLSSPVPTAKAPPTPEAASTSEPFAILSFTADPLEVDPGGTVTLTWATTGGAVGEISFYEFVAGLRTGTGPLPASGTYAARINDYERGWRDFVINVSDSAGAVITDSVRVAIRCPNAYFFTPPPAEEVWRCPYEPPKYVSAAEQLFEGGRMIWLATATIYVLFADGTWGEYYDTWTPGEPAGDPGLAPPDGLYQPLRGFGKLWGTGAGLRDRLGWALAPEQAFDGAFQSSWFPCCSRIYYTWRAVYVRAAEGRVVRLTFGGEIGPTHWEFVTP